MTVTVGTREYKKKKKMKKKVYNLTMDKRLKSR